MFSNLYILHCFKLASHSHYDDVVIAPGLENSILSLTHLCGFTMKIL